MSVSIRGVIFDFNGVLLWDTELHEEGWKTFSTKLRGHPLTQHELDEHVRGRTNKEIQEYVLGRTVNEGESRMLTEEKESLYRNACLALGAEFKLSPGSVEFLEHLQKKNIPFTIATSSEIGNVQFFFEHLSLSTWFDINSVVFDDGSLPSKPAPDIYLKAAEKIGIPPVSCLVVEDALSGIRSANSAGIGYIVALGPKEKHLELSQVSGVNLVVENVRELLHKGPLAA